MKPTFAASALIYKWKNGYFLPSRKQKHAKCSFFEGVKKCNIRNKNFRGFCRQRLCCLFTDTERKWQPFFLKLSNSSKTLFLISNNITLGYITLPLHAFLQSSFSSVYHPWSNRAVYFRNDWYKIFQSTVQSWILNFRKKTQPTE